jgi:hypothetical protein
MVIRVKHGFTSVKTDGADATQVQPSHWNADHTLQITGPALVGRETASLGDAAEISIGSGLTLSGGVLAATGGGGGGANLTSSTTSTSVTVLSDTGTDATLGAATGSVAGVMTAADKTKLDAISGSNTGDQTNITGNAGTATALSAGADRTKLDGIATAATANASDASLRDRTTHTGTQAISTVTGLQTALDGKAVSSVGIAVAGNKTLGPSDLDNVQDVSAAATLTIPNDATLGIAATDRVAVGAYQMTTGAVAWVAGAGVSPLRGDVPTAAQYKTTGLLHVGANEWVYIQ